MSFTGLLRHRVAIIRQVAVESGGEPTYTELGQPITADANVGEWPCLIQPKSSREVALLSQQGAVVADHTLFGIVADVREGDRLESTDGRSFEVQAVADAGGQDHHLEVDARRVASRDVEEPTS